METSLATILAPAFPLLLLLLIPKLIYFCAVFAYDGFKNGVTLTHRGMRKGVIAKFYSIFYSIFVIFFIFTIPFLVKNLLATDVEKIKQALFFAAPIPIL